MGEEVKTDVGSAAEQDQAAERRQQEIQKATVGKVEEWGGACMPFTRAARQITAERRWSRCSAHRAEGHRRQTVHTVQEARESSQQLDH